ncbi:hypothetical protein E0Z10_g8590 [Xylaria hypoxylon]|uniref:Uncharacterized protein n=1 Tax=Xylaria hypoxylon TaxID=37992 RepID=A0A4Z0Y8K7_9PEZI|nr:hypothetical protein E0Z10_g8590 [Xylaria hypoxylon]
MMNDLGNDEWQAEAMLYPRTFNPQLPDYESQLADQYFAENWPMRITEFIAWREYFYPGENRCNRNEDAPPANDFALPMYQDPAMDVDLGFLDPELIDPELIDPALFLGEDIDVDSPPQAPGAGVGIDIAPGPNDDPVDNNPFISNSPLSQFLADATGNFAPAPVPAADADSPFGIPNDQFPPAPPALQVPEADMGEPMLDFDANLLDDDNPFGIANDQFLPAPPGLQVPEADMGEPALDFDANLFDDDINFFDDADVYSAAPVNQPLTPLALPGLSPFSLPLPAPQNLQPPTPAPQNLQPPAPAVLIIQPPPQDLHPPAPVRTIINPPAPAQENLPAIQLVGGQMRKVYTPQAIVAADARITEQLATDNDHAMLVLPEGIHVPSVIPLRYLGERSIEVGALGLKRTLIPHRLGAGHGV